MLKLERGSTFEETFKRLEEAKEKCLSTATPDDHCHTTSLEALKFALENYDKILEDYKKRLPGRTSPAPGM